LNPLHISDLGLRHLLLLQLHHAAVQKVDHFLVRCENERNITNEKRKERERNWKRNKKIDAFKINTHTHLVAYAGKRKVMRV